MRPEERRVLVIGSGVAGLSFALRAAEQADVTVVTKKHRADSNTNYAQGGIAAVMEADDSPEDHVRDTLVAGAGLCHRRVVETVVNEGPMRVRELMEWGVEFTHERGRLSLGREGGHSHRRIVHARDRTGREIERALLDRVEAHPRIQVLDDHRAVELLVGPDGRTGAPRCAGALVLDETEGTLRIEAAAVTLLASGGLGRVYRHTTNPAIATGDGVAMAYRAGARVANLEFVQFHPTALFPAEERAVLISEAVRGEGAVLRRLDGGELMAGVHPMGSLAPRDVVARAIQAALEESGDEHALLDLSPIDADVIERRFPNILEECRQRGIDIRSEPIPVVPAAHYACGGVVTDLSGRSSLPGLRVVGESACTGLHGANRLASNSLLEAVVLARRAADALRGEWPDAPAETYPTTLCAPAAGRQSDDDAARLADEVRALMWNEAGIVRSLSRLARAEERLAATEDDAGALLVRHGAVPELLDLRNLAETARLVVRCARSRHESRGLHFLRDAPYRDNEHALRDTVLRGEGPAPERAR